MSTLSIPLPAALEAFVEQAVRRGVAPNKAEVVRQALARYAEDQAVEQVLRAEQELKEGKILRGNLKALIRALP